MGAKSHRQCLIRVLLLFKYHVATVNGECEAEVVRIYGRDTEIVLDVVNAIGTVHYSLNVGSTVVTVGNITLNLCTIHCCEPCSPISVSYTHLQLPTILRG